MQDKKDRRKDTAILVPALPEEKAKIQCQAAAAGLPVAVYLRRVGMGWPIRAVIDTAQIVELSKVNADLGRLGGLLKFWLTDEDKRQGREEQIRKILRQIEDSQEQLKLILDRL